MAFSASFTFGGLVTYWIVAYYRTGFDVSGAGSVWLALVVVAFVVSAIVYLFSRRAVETSAEAIKRQVLQAQETDERVHEEAR